MTVLITGSNGFIGSALTQHLHCRGYQVTAVVRHIDVNLPATFQQTPIGELIPNTDWSAALNNVDAIIHLAARVHVMHDTSIDPLTEFRRTNTAATLNLARQAAGAGVRRFIFLSSIKVNGETTKQGHPFIPDATFFASKNLPKSELRGWEKFDPYALSKHEAEQGLRVISQQTGMEVVIIRPPLVYGAGVEGNFQLMFNWLQKGIPLPLGSIHNKRSFLALPNLIDLITTCINHPRAANQTFLVSDGQDLSTTQLLQKLGLALGKPARLLPVPQRILEASLNFLGKKAIAQRLCGNLEVDITKTLDLLGWTPPVSVDEGLAEVAMHEYTK